MKTLLIAFFLVFIAFSVSAQSSYNVTQASGKVEISVSGRAWTVVSVGDQVPISATISTGFGSRATLEGVGAVISIEPLTRMTVNQLRANSGGGAETNLGLRTGRIRAAVRSTDAGRTRFSVSSPVATAAVRGTEFGFNGYKVDVGTGTVSLISGSTGRSVNVPQGANSKVDENGDPQSVADSKKEQSVVDSAAIPGVVDPLLSPAAIGGSSGQSSQFIVIIE
jgi:hypothetical protein